MALGTNVQVGCGATNSIVMGSGVSAANPLRNNNIFNSLMVGFNSNIPTFFVGASSGLGTTGNVGIGNAATTPTQKLDVDGKVRVRDLTGTPNDVLVTAENNGTLHRIAFTGNSTDVLLGDGTFGTPPPGNAWVLTGNNAPINNILGTTNPISLHIFAGGTQRQFIDFSTGFVGLGDGFSSPQNRLHLHQGTTTLNNNFVYSQWTNFNTGGATPAATNGFKVGIDLNGTAQLIQQENKNIIFYEKDNINNINERVRITTDPLIPTYVWTGPVTKMTINIDGSPSNIIDDPKAMLHIGYPAHILPNVFSNGARKWMNTGVYCSQETYNTYMGLQANCNTIDRKDAVINWGNSNYPTDANFNVLKFVYTTSDATSGACNLTPGYTASPTTFEGLEIMRMLQNGKVGIGPTFQLDAPQRRLEVVDKGNPQLRLTYSQKSQNVPQLDIYTDIETTNDGDLWINPIIFNNPTSITTHRNVCINFITPMTSLTTLDVNGDATIRTLINAPTTPCDVVVADAAGTLFRGSPNINFGGICGTLSPTLLSPWEIRTGGNNYNFSGTGRVNITNLTNCAPIAKFTVDDNQNNTTMMIMNNTNAAGNIGGFFKVLTTDASNPGKAIIVPLGGGYVGIGTSNPTAALEVSGVVRINGLGYITSGVWLPSDQIFKTNIQPVQNALNIISQLNPKSFYFDTTNVYGLNFSNKKHYGLIAQDVQNVLPELVSSSYKPATYDSTGAILTQSLTYLNLDYNSVFALLIQGMKEQQSKIDSSKQQNDSLKNIINSYETRFNNIESQLSQCCDQTGNAKIMNSINIELANDAVLYQNIPNPFGEETMINYYIPENTNNAKIIFFDMYGQSMKEVPLTETGSGNIHVDSKNLASGIYSYSLIIDGKVIDTKKMVRNK